MQAKQCVQVVDSHGNLGCIPEEAYEEYRNQQNNSLLNSSNEQQSNGDINFKGESSENVDTSNANIEKDYDVMMFVPNAIVI